jgi:flagellar biosynthesis/type III secretory pathway protein FliH
LSRSLIVRRPVSRVTVRPGRMTSAVAQGTAQEAAARGAGAAADHARRPQQPSELPPAVVKPEANVPFVDHATIDKYEQLLGAERARVAEFLENLEEQLEVNDQKMGRTVVQLAVTIAELIVKREVAVDRELVLREAREALRRVVGVQQLTLRVNPFDLDLVREQKSQVLAGSEAVREMRIEPDEAVARGGCIVESEAGNVDARLSTQLRNIETALLDAGREGQGDR